MFPVSQRSPIPYDTDTNEFVMAAPKLSHLLSDSRSLSNGSNALVWSRPGTGANLVIMTENEIAVGALPKHRKFLISIGVVEGQSN